MPAPAPFLLNPFQVGGMIRDDQKFFGRQRELNSLLRRVATMQSVSLFGPRLIGKSSLLFQLVELGPQLLGNDAIKFYYLNLQPLTAPEEFYQHACQLIAGSDGATHQDLEDALQGKQVVLCLDEFEQAIEAEFGEDFFKSLRSLAQSGTLALVVSTQQRLNELYQQETDLTSSFHNIFTSLPLGDFTDEETDQFLRRQCEREIFTAADCDVIRTLAGNDPYLLNLACYHAFELKQEGAANFAAELRARFNRERQPAAPPQPAPPPEPQRAPSSSAAHSAPHERPLRSALNEPSTQPDGAAVNASGSHWHYSFWLALIGLIIGGFSARGSNLLGATIAMGLFIAALVLLVFHVWLWPAEKKN